VDAHRLPGRGRHGDGDEGEHQASVHVRREAAPRRPGQHLLRLRFSCKIAGASCSVAAHHLCCAVLCSESDDAWLIDSSCRGVEGVPRPS
jgi:hypothetical protein